MASLTSPVSGLMPPLNMSYSESSTPVPFCSLSSQNNFESSRKIKLTLETLPFEIRELIAQQCLQADAFRLSLTCKALYDSTIARLYQCIIFDSSHRHFNKETNYKRLKPKTNNYLLGSFAHQSYSAQYAAELGNSSILASECESNYNELFFSYASVHTVGGMRRCIRTLTRDPSKAAYIQRFEVLNNIDISDFEFREFLENTLPNMKNLAILLWDCSPLLTPDLLRLVCQKSNADNNENSDSDGFNNQCNLYENRNIETLSLNIKFPQSNTQNINLSQLCFPNLRKVTIRPFLSSTNLRDVAVLVGNSPETVDNLQWLHLGRELDRTGYSGLSFDSAGSGGTSGLLSSSDPFFAFASLDPQGVISPAGSGGPLGNNRGVMDGVSNDRVTRGRAFWNMEGQVDDQCIPQFFNTLLETIEKRHDATTKLIHSPSSISSYGGTPKLQLEYLGLTGIMVNGHKDFALLERCVDLTCLIRLSITGADKYNCLVDDELPDIKDSEGFCLQPGFLLNFVSFGNKSKNRLQKLQAFTVDWTENGKDIVPETIARLPNGLKSLKVVIRWSAPKAKYLSWSQLCDMYSDSIVNSHQTSLENLVLDLGYDDTFGSIEPTQFQNHNTNDDDAHSPGGRNIASLSKESVKKLGACKKLKGLSILVHSITAMENIVSELPNLQFLRLRNSHSKPYLGQNTSYLLEDWLRYKHIVEGLWEAQQPQESKYCQDGEVTKSLKFIKLEGYIFELHHSISKTPTSLCSSVPGSGSRISISPLEPPLRGTGSSSEFQHLNSFDATRKRYKGHDIQETFGVGYYGGSTEVISSKINHNKNFLHHNHQQKIPPKNNNPSELQSKTSTSIILREGLTKWFTAKCEGATFVEEE